MFIGNDYVWPRVSHRLAARYVGDRGGAVLADRYLPFGVEDYSELLDEIAAPEADAILLSLVGQDAVEFNRAFGRCGLSRDMFRLSCAIEENGLLAIGADNTEGLFVSSGYFARSTTTPTWRSRSATTTTSASARRPSTRSASRPTKASTSWPRWRAAPPTRTPSCSAPLAAPLAFRSVRGIRYLGNDRCSQPTYLAEAGGHLFQRPIALVAAPRRHGHSPAGKTLASRARLL